MIFLSDISQSIALSLNYFFCVRPYAYSKREWINVFLQYLNHSTYFLGDLDFFIDGDGRWEIEYQAVQCPVGQTGLQYWFQGSDGWYLKVQTRNERYVQFGQNKVLAEIQFPTKFS